MGLRIAPIPLPFEREALLHSAWENRRCLCVRAKTDKLLMYLGSNVCYDDERILQQAHAVAVYTLILLTIIIR